MSKIHLIALSLIALLSIEGTRAQTEQRMAHLFKAMPDSLMPLLSTNNRRDMVDFLQNNMQARVRDNFGNYAELKALNDTYLRLESTAKSSTEMKLLQTTDSTDIVALIRTVKAPAADSQVAFYNTQWQRLRWLELPTPSIASFWDEAPDSLANAARYAQLSLADLRLIEVRAATDEPVFEFILQTTELAETEKKAAERLVHPLRYLWTDDRFRYLDPR